MNEIAARIRDYDNCHDGDIDAAADEIDRLEKVVAAQKETIAKLREKNLLLKTKIDHHKIGSKR